MIEFKASLISVRDMKISRKFYEDLFDMRVAFDFGENVQFAQGLALQADFAKLAGLPENSVTYKTHNFELYFDVDDLDAFAAKLEGHPSIQYVHGIQEYPWGQRVLRLYDPDGHIIEVGENMDGVVGRYLSKGLSVEEVAQRTQHPVEYVREIAKKR